MNLIEYISELLVQNNEVNVPGLGYFVRERVNAYYDDREAKFFPPYHRVKFIPQAKDDDTFAHYIADKKNISLASSKYFTEKFIGKLKDDAAKGAFLFDGIGSFHTDQDQLVFKPNEKIAGDPSFYGFPPVSVNKAGVPVIEHAKPIFAQPVVTPIITAARAQTTEPGQYIEEQPERKKRKNIWLILLIVIVGLAATLFAVYELYPEVFDTLSSSYNKIIGKEAPVVPVVKPKVKPDTIKKAVPITDTVAKDTAVAVKRVSSEAINPADTAKTSRWDIIVDAFKKQETAITYVDQYKKRGINATVLLYAPGKYFVSAGSYPTRDEAEAARIKLVNAKKISETSYPLEIKPKK
jgi:hypothetical protein